jgi:hypothetical protein
VLAFLCLTPTASAAQAGAAGASSSEQTQGADRREDPRRAAMRRMMRTVTVSFEEQRLEEVLNYLSEIAGVRLEALWLEDRYDTGLDRDTEITIEAKDISVLNLLERVLDKATTDDFDAPTWQLSRDDATIEVGPRSRLNRRAFLKVYYIHDLVFVIPDFEDAPELDLNSILGGGGGGGGTESPFEDTEDDEGGGGLGGAALNQEAIDQLLDVIRLGIEPDQWRDNGGSGGVIRLFRGQMIVRAPAYIHRQLGGFDFAPRRYRPFVNDDRLDRRRAKVRSEDQTEEADGTPPSNGDERAGGDGADDPSR